MDIINFSLTVYKTNSGRERESEWELYICTISKHTLSFSAKRQSDENRMNKALERIYSLISSDDYKTHTEHKTSAEHNQNTKSYNYSPLRVSAAQKFCDTFSQKLYV